MAINKSRKTRVKTFIKKVKIACDSGSKDAANQALSKAQSEIMRAVSSNILHKNTASRKISRLSANVKSLSLSD